MNLKSTFLFPLSIFSLVSMGVVPVAQAQYCSPSSSYGCSWANIESFSTTGGLTNITNNGTGCGSSDYTDYTTTMLHTAVQGDVVNFSFENSTGSLPWGPSCGFKIWVDYNSDGDFDDADEKVYETDVPGSSNYIACGGVETGSFTVPLTATVGTTRLRIRCIAYNNDFDPCATPSWSDGEAEDYAFQIVPNAPPDNAGIDSLVNPRMNGLFCSGNQEVKVRLRNLGNNGLHSVTINWSIDGALQTPVSYNTYMDSIASADNWAIIPLGTVDFPFNTPVALKSWTSQPNGVTDNDFSDDTLSVTVAALKQNVDVQISPQDTAICLGDAIVLDAGIQPAGAIYVWSTGDVTQTASIDAAGTYTVKVQSLGGCSKGDTIIIAELPQPQALNLGVVDDGGNNYTFTVNGQQNIDTYHWDFGDQSIETGPGPKSHSYTYPGLFAVSVTVGNACNSINFTRQIQIETTGIADINGLQKAISLSPNPARSQVKLEVKGAVSLQHVSVYNVVGQQVYDAAASGRVLELNTSAFANGLYQVVIDTDKGQAIKKLEIVK